MAGGLYRQRGRNGRAAFFKHRFSAARSQRLFGLPLGGWRRIFDQYTVFSFQPQILAEVTPQLHFEDAKCPARLLRIDDPINARIMPLANNWAYYRTRETSLNNLRLLSDRINNCTCPRPVVARPLNFCSMPSLSIRWAANMCIGRDGDNFGRWTSVTLENQPPGRRTAKDRGPTRLRGPALELVPRPGSGSQHD